MKEIEIQKNILFFLTTVKKCVCWGNKTQGTYDPVKKVFRKRPDMKRGVSDILGLTPSGRFIAVEVKTKEGLKKYERNKYNPKFSEFYEFQFLQDVNNNKGIGLIATSTEDLLTINFN